MSQVQQISLTFPIGRLINGEPHTENTTDQQGNPLLIKNGPNTGQPRSEWRFAVAIQKTQQDWMSEVWAQQLLAAAKQGYPHLFGADNRPVNAQTPFAYKVMDGDSQVPNSNGNKPCDMEGAPGNWVVWMSNGFAPKLYDWNGSAAVPLNPDDQIKCGYYVEVYCTVGPNGATGNQQGIFINPSMVCKRAYGDEIVTGPNVSAAGFGGGQLPSGASAAPVGGQAVQTTQASTTVEPAHDLAQGPGADLPPPPLDDVAPPQADDPILVYNNQEKPRSQWLAMNGWTEALVNAHCKPKV